MCHYYNYYFAHTAGGRMIGSKVRSMFAVAGALCSEWVPAAPQVLSTNAPWARRAPGEHASKGPAVRPNLASSTTRQVSSMILDNAELEFYKYEGDVGALLDGVRGRVAWGRGHGPGAWATRRWE